MKNLIAILILLLAAGCGRDDNQAPVEVGLEPPNPAHFEFVTTSKVSICNGESIHLSDKVGAPASELPNGLYASSEIYLLDDGRAYILLIEMKKIDTDLYEHHMDPILLKSTWSVPDARLAIAGVGEGLISTTNDKKEVGFKFSGQLVPENWEGHFDRYTKTNGVDTPKQLESLCE